MVVKPAFLQHRLPFGKWTICRLFGQVDKFRIADIHVSHLSSGAMGVPGTLARACKSRVPGCFYAHCLPLGIGSCARQNQTSICCLSPAGPAQKIELVISCQSRNNSMGASRAYAPSPSRQLTRPGRLRAEEILLYFAPAMQRCSFGFLLPENLFAGDQQRLGTPPSSAPRPVLRGWHCLFVSPVRIPSPVLGYFAVPFLPPQSEPSADVCCVVSRVACAW